jgi:hypothetical protein
VPDGVLPVVRQVKKGDADLGVTGSDVRSGPTCDGAFVERLIGEADRERAEGLFASACGDACDRRRVDASTQEDANVHVGLLPESNRFFESRPKRQPQIVFLGARAVLERVVEIPVLDDLCRSSVAHEIVPGWNLVDPGDQRLSRRLIEKQRSEVRPPVPRRRRARFQDRFRFRCDHDTSAGLGPVERLDAEPVTSREENAPATVPARKRELASELFQAIDGRVLVQMNDDFAVTSCGDAVTARREVSGDGLETIQLAIEGQLEAAVLVRHRLIAERQILDRQTRMTEACPAGGIEPQPTSVGTAMGETADGAREGLCGQRFRTRHPAEHTAHRDSRGRLLHPCGQRRSAPPRDIGGCCDRRAPARRSNDSRDRAVVTRKLLERAV